MRENENTIIEGEKVILVPYRKHHVERYHEWMKDSYLQEMTASEPLSLEEEYEMQLSWWKDSDKCTFIILDRHFLDHNEDGGDESVGGSGSIEAMVGDVNLYFNEFDEHPEIEVMIAETKARRKGLAKEAILLMMKYAHTNLTVPAFSAKILDHNGPSLGLFKKLGYLQTGHSEYFSTTTLTAVVSDGNGGGELGVEKGEGTGTPLKTVLEELTYAERKDSFIVSEPEGV
eukprot:TRINITY_DN785_c0_g1_i1.p1 TRINITY_DN785_c0_g1~~TRINITY_DN785_c0_g1_i1.p1  ORF type:complete len:230 (+),score=52.47 TRINITY_DN785_c0_g1_i1:251-940(+)